MYLLKYTPDCYPQRKACVNTPKLRQMPEPHFAQLQIQDRRCGDCFRQTNKTNKFIEKENNTCEYMLNKLETNFINKHQTNRICWELILKPFISHITQLWSFNWFPTTVADNSFTLNWAVYQIACYGLTKPAFLRSSEHFRQPKELFPFRCILRYINIHIIYAYTCALCISNRPRSVVGYRCYTKEIIHDHRWNTLGL